MFKVVLISTAIICIIVLYFIISIVKQQKRISSWQKARIKAEIDTLEMERGRIAKDLHDNIGPLLSAVKFQINHLEPTDETEQALVKKSSDQIDTIIQDFRNTSYNLLPNTLVRKGLVKAAEEFIHRLQKTNGVNIQLMAETINLPKEKEIILFRIIQEIVHNTVKHSKGDNLHISLTQHDGFIVMETADNGVGFTYVEKMKVANGLGLLGLQSRVEVLNGQMEVASEPGAGTKYHIRIPVEHVS
jgi:two-component system, NarL family, sensor kinase